MDNGFQCLKVFNKVFFKVVDPPKETVATDVMKNPSKVVLLRVSNC